MSVGIRINQNNEPDESAPSLCKDNNNNYNNRCSRPSSMDIPNGFPIKCSPSTHTHTHTRKGARVVLFSLILFDFFGGKRRGTEMKGRPHLHAGHSSRPLCKWGPPPATPAPPPPSREPTNHRRSSNKTKTRRRQETRISTSTGNPNSFTVVLQPQNPVKASKKTKKQLKVMPIQGPNCKSVQCQYIQ